MKSSGSVHPPRQVTRQLRCNFWLGLFALLLMLACSAGVPYSEAQGVDNLHAFRGTLTSLPLEIRSPLIAQLAELTASDGATDDSLGLSVAVSGNTAVVGAYNATIGGNQAQGAAYVFVATNGWTNMTQAAKLTASDGTAFSNFGLAVAISGDTIAVESGLGDFTATAYVFVKPASGWADMTETAELTTPKNSFGSGAPPSIVTDGSTVYVGVPWAPSRGATYAGMAYIFVEPTGGWTNTATPTASLYGSDVGEESFFGQSMSLSGNILAIASSSRVYLFLKPARGWTGTRHQNAELAASNGDPISRVSLRGSTLAAGSPDATLGSNRAQGAVYVFLKPAGGWVNATETAKLIASDGAAIDQLGDAVSVNRTGTAIVAGAPGRKSYTGAVYLFTKPAGGWVNATQNVELTASDWTFGDLLGLSVTISGPDIFAGAPQFAIGTGKAYVFGR